MKRFSRLDYFCFGSLVLVGIVLTFGSQTGQGKDVPLDDRHRPIYLAVKEGRSRAETEMVCATCHGKGSIPLPKGHPPKDECLLCHLLAGD